MKQTKLIKLLSLLSSKELQKLGGFVKSAYFNKDEKIVNLVSYLSKKAPDFEVSKESCYKAAFKEDVLNDAALRRLFYRTLKLVEQFILIEQVRSKKEVQYQLLTEFCLERDSKQDTFEFYLKAGEKAIVTVDWIKQFLYHFLLMRDKLMFATLKRSQNVYVYKAKQSFIEILDEYITAVEKMIIRVVYDVSITCFSTKLNPIKDISYEERFISKLQQLMKDNNKMILQQWKDNTGILQGVLVYQLLNDMNPDHYHSLKEMVINDTSIHVDNQVSTLKILLQYLYLLREKTSIAHNDKWFEIYNILIDKDLIFFHGKVLPVVFFNVVKIAGAIGKLIWAEQFIVKYKNKLPKEHQFHIIEASWGELSFHQKNFEKAMEHYENLKNARSYMYNIQARQREIRVYYEIDDFRLESALQSLKVMISRSDKHAIDLRYRNKLFVNFLLRLMNIPPSKKEKLQQLKTEIIDSYTNCKEWLIEKVEEKLKHS